MFILGDFYHCKMEYALPGFHQYVSAGRRKNNTLDKCYGNIKDGYASKIRLPLANSDHNTVRLILTYKSILKRNKPTIKTVSVWLDGSKEELSECFFATGWSDDIDNTAEAITGCIDFCVDTVTTKRTIKSDPNNKDNITPEIKRGLRWKQQAFRSNNVMNLNPCKRSYG